MNYQRLCSQILKIDPKVRFAAVYNKWAEHLASETKDGLSAHLPAKQTQESVNQAILRWESRKKMDQWVGKPKYAMAEYEKLKRFTFYLSDEDLLLVTTEPDADHIVIITMIQKLISESNLG